jgi:hypothetical protein
VGGTKWPIVENLLWNVWNILVPLERGAFGGHFETIFVGNRWV